MIISFPTDTEPQEMTTAHEFVRLRITEIFDDLAERISEIDLPEDFAAGVPMALFAAEMHLKGAWDRYCVNEDEAMAIADDPVA